MKRIIMLGMAFAMLVISLGGYFVVYDDRDARGRHDRGDRYDRDDHPDRGDRHDRDDRR